MQRRCEEGEAGPPGKKSSGTQLRLYKILFRFKALLWKSIMLVSPPPTCKAYPIAILLHGHWAIYALLPTPVLYAVNHTILVKAISCKGHYSASSCSSFSPNDSSAVGSTL